MTVNENTARSKRRWVLSLVAGAFAAFDCTFFGVVVVGE